MQKSTLCKETIEAIILMYGYPREELMETPDGDIYGWSVYNNNLEMVEIKRILNESGIVNLYCVVS